MAVLCLGWPPGLASAECRLRLDAVEQLDAGGRWVPVTANAAAGKIQLNAGGRSRAVRPGETIHDPASVRVVIPPGYRVVIGLLQGARRVDAIRLRASRSGRPARLDAISFDGKCSVLDARGGTFRFNLKRRYLLLFPRVQLMNEGTKLTVGAGDEPHYVLLDEGTIRARSKAGARTVRAGDDRAAAIVLTIGGGSDVIRSGARFDALMARARLVGAYPALEEYRHEGWIATLEGGFDADFAVSAAVSRRLGGGIGLTLLSRPLGSSAASRLGGGVSLSLASAPLEGDAGALEAALDAVAALTVSYRVAVGAGLHLRLDAGPAFRLLSSDTVSEGQIAGLAQLSLGWTAYSHASGAFGLALAIRGLLSRTEIGDAEGIAGLIGARLALFWEIR